MKKWWMGIVILVLTVGAAAAQDVAPPAPPPGGLFIEEPQEPPKPMIARAPKMAGQPDLGKWWKNSDIVRELEVSESQVNQLEQAFLDHRLKLIDLRAAVEREELRLQPLIEVDQLDLPKVSAQLDAVLAARGRLEKESTMMMLSLRKVLTVEQWKKLQGIHMRHEGPGMMKRRMPPPGAPEATMRKRMPGPGQPGQPAPPPQPPQD